MENKNDKDLNKRAYTYLEWQESVFAEIEQKAKESENTLQKFRDLAHNSPAHAIEYYSESVVIAAVTLQELSDFNDKLILHPTLTMLGIIKDKMKRYLQLYKHHDFRHNSTSLIANAINIWRNQAYADVFEIFERAVNLHDRIDK